MQRRLFLFATLLAWALFLGACSDSAPDDTPRCADGQRRGDAGECVAAECVPSDCPRGVCGDGECINAEDCSGDDERCLAGYFCDGDGACQPDLCADRTECSRGACQPTTGECADVHPCESSLDCLDGRRCLGDTCTADADLCDGGCSGGQVCDFDEQTRSAECVEPTRCSTSLDCHDGRVCAGRHCLSAPACQPDPLEPNDSTEAAADLGVFAHLGVVDATLCSGDRDVYALTVSPPADNADRRDLLVELEFPTRQIGHGDLQVELIGPDGDTTVATTDGEASVRIEQALGLGDFGTYHIDVSPADDLSAGVNYRLVALAQPRQTANWCAQATTIDVGQTYTGDTHGEPSPLHGRCASAPTGGAELLAVDVDQKSRLSARITAADEASFTVGIRSACRRADTEAACVAVGAGAQRDLDDVVVEPGRYFVIVQSPTPADEGSFELRITATPVDCASADDSCFDTGTSRYCASGQRLTNRTCVRGCQAHTGRCLGRTADTCESAPLVTDGDSVEIDWSEFAHDYHMRDGGCLPIIGGTDVTAGPDAVYRVHLPADHVLTAHLASDLTRRTSLYALEDCLSPVQRCVAGANDDPPEAELLQIDNADQPARTLFLVADSSADVRGSAQLDIDVEPIVCSAWQSRCDGDAIQHCNDTRTGFETVTQCAWGCSQSSCNPAPGQTCAGAPVLSSGQTIASNFTDYDADHDLRLTRCDPQADVDSPTHAGPEGFFALDLNEGDLLTADLTTAADAGLFVMQDCSLAPTEGCLWGSARAAQLEFYAPETRRYYLGMAAEHDGEDADFELSVDVQPGGAVCQPGGTSCDASNDELVVCSQDGGAERQRMACPYGCQGRSCSAPPTLNNTCPDAASISGPVRIVDDLERFTNDYSSSGCGVGHSTGPDSVYRVDLAADEVLTVSAQPFDRWTPAVYVLSDCADPANSCVAGEQAYRHGESADMVYRSWQAETVYLVVDSRSAFYSTDLTFQLDVDISPVACQPGQTRCASGSELEYCDQFGLYSTYGCTGGCSQGSCATPTGGVCSDAIAVSDGDTVHGDWLGENRRELHVDWAAACRHTVHDQTDGPDTFYRIDLAAGDLLEVDLLTGYQHALVYFLDSCAEFDACAPGLHVQESSRAQYFADSAGPVWVAVDARRPSPQPFSYELSFDVQPGASCLPGSVFCVDSDTAGVCAADASGAEQPLPCAEGCHDGGCGIDPGASQCTTAPDVGEGIAGWADIAQLSDDVQLGAGSCVSYASGLDLAFEVTVPPGEVLHARGGSTAYLIDDCSDPAGSCVSGPLSTVSNDGARDEILWATGVERTVTVVFEYHPQSTGSARFFIETLPAECAPGSRQCSADGESVEVCASYARWQSVACQTTCTSGACDLPSGDRCEDPIAITAPQTLRGRFGDFRDHTDPEALWSEGCSGFSGPDAVYAIDLQQDDLLEAKLLSGESRAGMYLLDDCQASAADACVEEAPQDTELTYLSPADGTYYLVVDATNGQARGEFAVNVDRRQVFCKPGATRCDGAGQSVERCSDSGSHFEPIGACSLGCSDGTCTTPTPANNTCGDALDIGQGALLIDDLSRFVNDYDSPACFSDSTGGSDAVYRVDLSAGEVLSAELRHAEPSSSGLQAARLYISSDCPDVEGSCDASGIGGRHAARVSYTATADETVYLVVDTAWSTGLDFALDVDVRPDECTPGTSTCLDANTVEECPHGLAEPRPCAGGCNAGACDPAPTDTCTSAPQIPADGDYHGYRVHLDDHSNTVNLWDAYYEPTECTVYRTPGPEAFYAIDASAGDTLSVDWEWGRDMVVWLTESCSMAAPKCVADAENAPFEHTFEADGSYWLVVDTGFSPPDGALEFDARLQPQVCTPHETSCTAEPREMLYCTRDGTAERTYACDGVCDDSSGTARCTQPRGDRCFDAIDATGGGRFTLDLDGHADSQSPREYGCSFFEAYGQDAVLRVDAQAGEVIEATVLPPPGRRPVAYILDSCQGAPTCTDTDAPSAGQSATVTHTAAADGSYYIVVDSANRADSSTPWTVDVSVH
jgi:hypothetical protein